MMRKPMEDVVTHSADKPRPIAINHSLEQNEGAQQWRPSQPRQGNNRIENNPFFKKERSSAPFVPQIKQRSSPRTFLWSFAFLAFFVVAFFVINHFSSATIEVVPTSYTGHVDGDFIALKQASGDTPTTTEASLFHFISFVDTKSETVTPTIDKKIENKASGQVIIYNAYSKNSQKLISNTRFESADHKIFRIQQPVVVPGATMVAGKVSQPGSVEVTVYADAAGPDYNIGLGDFTIPGFKGDPRYSKFTARSKSDSPISGGFIGTVKVPSDADIKAAEDDIKLSMKTTSVEKARALIPSGMSFFPGSTIIKFEDVPQNYSAGSITSVAVKATVSIFFFDTASLTQKLAESALTGYKGNPLLLPNMASLTFTFNDPIDNVVLSDLTQIHFHLAGNPLFVGAIDIPGMQTLLAGKEKGDFGQIIAGQINIAKADATIRPMWKTRFPTDPSKITIKILPPEA